MAAKRRGRKWKLTEDTITKICNVIESGSYAVIACRVAGVSESAYYGWLREGEAHPRGRCGKFARRVAEAEARAEARVVAQIQRQVVDDWRAGISWLERRHRSRWGRSVLEGAHLPEGSELPLIPLAGLRALLAEAEPEDLARVEAASIAAEVVEEPEPERGPRLLPAPPPIPMILPNAKEMDR